MSEQRSVTPTVGTKSGVGVGADAERRTGMSVRAGTTLMKSVSIFLTSGRKASANSKRQISAVSVKDESSRRRRRRRMPEGGGARNSAYIVKVIESLKKKTRFSRRVCRNASTVDDSRINFPVFYFIILGKERQTKLNGLFLIKR